MASLFFSYSHRDEGLRDQLEAHLALLKIQGLIDAWHDRRIVAGDELDDVIFNKLEEADVILLLVSSDFLNSSYCFSREMKRAMERHDAGEARVIPVILRHCLWQSAPFGKLMAAPKDGKPVMAWPSVDEAFTDVAKQVEKAALGLNKGRLASRVPAAPPATPLSSAARIKPRSSNLRLSKEFTEKDRDEFLRGTFEFVCAFFDGSIATIQERNPDVTGSYERIDSRRMSAVLYRNGRTIAQCSVRLEGLGGRSNALAFSHDASARQGTFNEMLNVESTDQALVMKPLGMSFQGGRDKQLSQEGAAEYLWDLFIRDAQR